MKVDYPYYVSKIKEKDVTDYIELLIIFIILHLKLEQKKRF